MILRSLTSQGKSTPEFRLAIIAIVVFVAMGALSPDRFLSSQNIVSMAMETMFCDDRNLSGDKAPMATKTTMAMIASLNSGVDFP